MSKVLFGQALFGIALISGFAIGCTTDGGDDSPTPEESPTPVPGPAFTVSATCESGSAAADDVVYLEIDSDPSGKHLADYPTVELYDDYTKSYYNNDPSAAYAEDHTLELFDSGRSTAYYEIWQRELSIAVDGSGNPDADVQEPDVSTVFTCDFFDASEITYVFCATDNDTLEEYCYAGGKHPTTFCPDCELAE